MSKTRVVHLKTGQLRDEAANEKTAIVDMEPVITGASFKRLFLLHYEQIRDLCLGFERPGLGIVAIDERGICGRVGLAAKPDRINTAVIGRHGAADLYLEGDTSLSLRHLLAIIFPLREKEDIRFRLLDLRTVLAFCDEHGRRLEALEAEGPVFVACGRYVLFILPTGEKLPWPEQAEEGWDCVPERVYLDDAPAEPDRWRRRRAMAAGDRRDREQTLVRTLPGPAQARRRLLREGEDPQGEIEIQSDERRSGILVGARALAEGVLLGRYERCDSSGLEVLADRNISRVHLMVIRIGDLLWAIDTASTNGVFVDGEEVRLTPLEYESRVVLAKGAASLRYKPVH